MIYNRFFSAWSLAGCWFGSFFSIYIYMGIIPADFHIFQRGWNHQPVAHWGWFIIVGPRNWIVHILELLELDSHLTVERHWTRAISYSPEFSSNPSSSKKSTSYLVYMIILLNQMNTKRCMFPISTPLIPHLFHDSIYELDWLHPSILFNQFHYGDDPLVD